MADDIKDFKIEGMSIGDSLLNFFSEKDIKSRKITTYPNSDKYYVIAFPKKGFYETYEVTQFLIKKNDNKYMIHSVSGKLMYDNQFTECNKKKDLISKEISRTISIKPQIDNGDILPGDSTGKSISNSISYFFDNDDQIMIDCSDWSDAVSYGDNLKVVLLPNYINRWILDEAFN
jgi:hypothetical protein